jgi:hypothetical protein
MIQSFGEYQRLARGLCGCSSLWVAEDHLLYVHGWGLGLPVMEEYLRFDFTRIQALSLTRTLTWWLWLAGGLLIAGASGGLAGVAYLAARAEMGPGDLWIIPSVFCVLLTLLALLGLSVVAGNLLLGPSCVVTVQTRTNTYRLRPLRRWRAARRALDQLGPRITAAQRREGGPPQKPEIPGPDSARSLELGQ